MHLWKIMMTSLRKMGGWFWHSLPRRMQATNVKNTAIMANIKTMTLLTGASRSTARKYYMQWIVSHGRKRAAEILFYQTMFWSRQIDERFYGLSFEELIDSDYYSERISKDIDKTLAKYF